MRKLGSGGDETERLHIKITDAELAAIEDWRYANRVPSKSEAVRRLVKIGLLSSIAFNELAEKIGNMLEIAARDVAAGKFSVERIERLMESGEPLRHETELRAFESKKARAELMFDYTEVVHLMSHGMLESIGALSEAKNYEAGLQQAMERITSTNERLAAVYRENRERMLRSYEADARVELAAEGIRATKKAVAERAEKLVDDYFAKWEASQAKLRGDKAAAEIERVEKTRN